MFWRIAKGGPGLPKESTPWNSAMPAWEDRLTEEQIWQVIYYLYETTGHPPARDGVACGAAGRVRAACATLLARRRRRARPAVRRAPSPATSRWASRCTRSAARGATASSGKGDGPAAELLVPRPRDFTAGKYKIRTQVGPLASDQDLLRIVTEGMPGTVDAVLAGRSRIGSARRSSRTSRRSPRAYKGAQARGPSRLPKEVAALGGVAPPGQEDVRRLRVRQVPRPGGPGRPGAGLGPQG